MFGGQSVLNGHRCKRRRSRLILPIRRALALIDGFNTRKRHDTMSSSRTGVRGLSRRELLTALGGTASIGVAGCLNTASGTDQSTTSEGPSETPTDADPTATPNPTTIPESELNPADEFDCGALGSSMPMQAYDPSSRPFVFTFDHPENWIPEAFDTPTYDATIVHAPYELETGGFLFDVYVRQYYQPVAEDLWDQTWDDSWDVVGTLTFAGEERRIVEKPSGDPGRFILSAVVPDTGAATETYRQVTLDARTLSFDEGCHAGYRKLGDAMVRSLRPRE